MISAIITTFTDYGDYTTPLIRSMKRFEKEPIEFIVVDNASRNPYPVGPDYKLIRFNTLTNWSTMLNTGVDASNGDWVMLLNDDVLCRGPFIEMVEGLDKNNVYGPAMRHKKPGWFDVGVQVNYLYAWLLVMRRSVFDLIGGFDEWYPKAGVDDIDFCWRAEQAGFPLVALDFPFIHLEPHRRVKWDGYEEQMKKSIEYFVKKVKGNRND